MGVVSLDRFHSVLIIQTVYSFLLSTSQGRPQEGGGIAQAWATWPEGAQVPNGTVICRGQGVPDIGTPAMRQQQFCSFFICHVQLINHHNAALGAKIWR